MATTTVESGFIDDWQGERTLAECNLHMLKFTDTCDVTFWVGQNEDIARAHRYILISRSCVFYSMLCGDWSKEESISIPDVSKDIFTEFLTFLYTDDCSLTADNATGVLYLSKKYAVHRLHRLCLSFLQTNLTPENACVVLEQAHCFDEDELFQQALTIVTTNGNVSLLTPGFRDLCLSCLNKVLISNDIDLYANKDTVFECILSWASAECSRQGREITPRNQRDVLGETVYEIGFTGFDAAFFVQKIVTSKLLDDSECLKILSNINCPDTDVGRFRKVDSTFRSNGEETLHEVEVYKGFRKPSESENNLFRLWGVHDALDIKCDQKTLLHGITVVPSELLYFISVTQEGNTILRTEHMATLTCTKLAFHSTAIFEPGLTYCVSVSAKIGNCPPLFLTSTKDEVCSPNKRFQFSQDRSDIFRRGLIMKLTVS